ncbi:serine threonine-protein kinase plk2 [Lasius niger]|uniref:Serine threonine-protein kinase plk2 n=1 Tax=Lasius niger TaxID=67767 RepID=A0A0J7KQW6_LASNI|nr:serine threonine-protein kinase plk2 [Lasius niger]
MCGAELRPVEATTTTYPVARCREEFDETIRTVSEPECTKRRIDSAGTGSTRSVPDARSGRQGFSKGSASLQSLVRRRSRRHGGSSLPSEIELSSRQAVYPAVPSDLIKDTGGAAVFRNEEEAQTATPTSTLVYATSSAQPSTSRADNPTQDVSSSASNVATTTGSNVTSTTNGGRFGNAAISLLRTTGVAKPGPSTSSSWNNSAEQQESDYVVDPVQGNAYYKGQFLGKVRFFGLNYLPFIVSEYTQRF